MRPIGGWHCAGSGTRGAGTGFIRPLAGSYSGLLDRVADAAGVQKACKTTARSVRFRCATFISRPHLCGWIARIPGGAREDDGLETGSEISVGACFEFFCWPGGGGPFFSTKLSLASTPYACMNLKRSRAYVVLPVPGWPVMTMLRHVSSPLRSPVLSARRTFFFTCGHASFWVLSSAPFALLPWLTVKPS